MAASRDVIRSPHDRWGVDLDLLDLPCMPADRQDFFQRVQRLHRECWPWSAAQNRAFNKIWGHLEQLEAPDSRARGGADAPQWQPQDS